MEHIAFFFGDVASSPVETRLLRDAGLLTPGPAALPLPGVALLVGFGLCFSADFFVAADDDWAVLAGEVFPDFFRLF